MTKVDRASMAHSLEVRVPLLDHELVEWTTGIEPGLKLKGGEGKYILKKAMEPHLPREVLYRTKMGFTAPTDHWFKNELRERLAGLHRESRLADCGLFDMSFVKKMVEEHKKGINKFSSPLWSLMVFDAFLGKTLSDEVPRVGSPEDLSSQGTWR